MNKIKSTDIKGSCVTLRGLARAFEISPATMGALADQLGVGVKAGDAKNSPRVFNEVDVEILGRRIIADTRQQALRDRAQAVFADDAKLETFRRLLVYAKVERSLTSDQRELLAALEERPRRPAGPVKITPELNAFFSWHTDTDPQGPRARLNDLIKRCNQSSL